MSLTMKDVSTLLGEFNHFKFSADLHGFKLGDGWHADNRVISERLVHGGGIAGAWYVEQQVSPSTPGRIFVVYGSIARTRAGLRRIIREWLAGDQPCNRPGYTQHAKLNHHTGAYVWCYRRSP